MEQKKWLNRNIRALGFASLFSDFGQEMITVLLPGFITALGGTPAILGLIEGVADASVSVNKFFSGWLSDVVKKRKPFIAAGYFIGSLGAGLFFLATSWLGIFFARVVSRFGKGVREPARDALLSESVSSAMYGRAFGFVRAMDSVGAVLGPLLAYALINVISIRMIFLVAMVLVFGGFLAIQLINEPTHTAVEHKTMRLADVFLLPKQVYWYLAAVTVFSFGNFAVSLRILRTVELLTPAYGLLHAQTITIVIYTLYNIIYASFSYPVGRLADAIGKRSVLLVGYILTAVSCAGYWYQIADMWYLTALFFIAGFAVAITDALQRAFMAELLPHGHRGMGYGLMAALQSLGKLGSSVMVGFLWTYVSVSVGFGFAACMCFAAALLLLFVGHKEV